MELLKSLILLLAGVGIFIVGMNMMGDGLEKGRRHFSPFMIILK